MNGQNPKLVKECLPGPSKCDEEIESKSLCVVLAGLKQRKKLVGSRDVGS